MFSTISVTVQRPVMGAKDRFGNATKTYTTETVDGVLVVPGAAMEIEAARPEGVVIAYTLHFPKTYVESLEGCIVTLPAPWSGDYRVVGNPGQYMAANTPALPWGMPVEVEAAHG